MATFIGLLRKEAKSDFGVDFPDFPGCVTAGSTLDETSRMAVEALRMHIEGMIEDGEHIPAPSALDDILNDPDNREAIPILVDVPVAKPRVVRVNITLPEELLEQIDRVTKNRSGWLADAARKSLRVA